MNCFRNNPKLDVLLHVFLHANARVRAKYIRCFPFFYQQFHSGIILVHFHQTFVKVMLQPEELLLLPRKELQLLAKSHGLKANASNSLLIEQLLNINNNFQENNGGNESMRSSTSTTDTANNQFPGLIKSVKAELECKLLIESNKVPLRKSLSAQSNDQQASAQVSSPPSSQEKDVGQWAVSMQKCIGELVKSDSFISCASKLNSASKQTLKRISPIRTVTSSSIQVVSRSTLKILLLILIKSTSFIIKLFS